MTSSWHLKKEKLRLESELRAERAIPDETIVKDQASEVAMGGGEEELFERKMTKEEKKAAAKAAREAKRKARKKKTDEDEDKKDGSSALNEAEKLLKEVKEMEGNVETMHNLAADALVAEGTICTFSRSKKGVDGRSRDVNVQNFTLQHKGLVMLDGTQIVLNHGNRYGLIGRNGCGKSTLMKALGARAVSIPEGIDIFHLKEEIEPSDTVTALDAVMSVDEERARLEGEAEKLNAAMAAITEAAADPSKEDSDKTLEEQQDEIMEMLNVIYERLDDLDADTAETKARSILKGLGFTHQMQSKLTKDFSGGWRMRVSLARALFIQPMLLLLDEPTNHLDMEAVIWLEEYLSKWNRILLLISHSQDFLNNVCTHTIHFTHKRKLEYYDGNYDQFIKTKREKEENQLKKWKWEQDQIESMKDYIARFGHGTSKNAKQAQSKEKVLQKMIRAGLTEKPDAEKPMNFNFPDPGHLPPPVLAFRDVSFAYPGCQLLYSNVNFGVDLDSRVALVGPNGAGKTTLVKLMAGELQPTLGDIRPHGHLKLGRFTQHFVDVLELDLTPLEFFGREYPNDTRDDMRKFLGRFGISGTMQVQKMEELSDGQKSRVVFAKLARDTPHILLLDEPTNHLDMESIDALALAIQQFQGGLVLVSHDMRLISQVAKEIWLCDHNTIQRYQGDIQHFKMDMRAQMGIDSQLKGDASVIKKEDNKKKKVVARKATRPVKKKDLPFELAKPIAPKTKPSQDSADALWGSDDETMTTQSSYSSYGMDSLQKNLPSGEKQPNEKYTPPHLRNR